MPGRRKKSLKQVKKAGGRVLEFYQLRKNKVHKFKPKVEIFSERGNFILKTVTETDELIQALRLRYQVFHREMIGKTKPVGIDVDEFDFICDHLVIKDKKTHQVIGTYRLNCSLFSDHFYSANEFHLAKIMALPGTKLELGRACIHKDYRKGIVISLLWRGIAEYMTKTKSRLMFGCASIKTESPRQAALLHRHFQLENRFHEEYLCPPTADYQMPSLDLWIESMKRPLTSEEQSEVEGLIPPLCRAYLKAGAYLGGEPAWDEEFKCIDFLTILEAENLNKALWRKYNVWDSGRQDMQENQE
jgi:putative hemolysin